jgi:peptidoglycan/xylan/chitin deacetylase (PgdA/CDA1 family)
MRRFISISFFLLIFLFALHLCSAQTRTVAITVDDLPFAPGEARARDTSDAARAAEVNNKLLNEFARQGVPVTGFVNERGVEELGKAAGILILQQWTQRGFDLGNHFYSHPDLNALTVEQAEQEIVRGEATIVPLMRAAGRKVEFLRFPFNHSGDTKEKHDAIAAFIKSRGYRIAPCTIENSDWSFNAAYVKAKLRGDEPMEAKIRATYLEYTAEEIDYYSALDKQVFGYEPPHVMLLHDNQLNADTIKEVLELFKTRGYKFVSLSEAEKDQAYSVSETYITQFGPMWGYRWAKELNVKVDGRLERDPPKWVDEYTAK